MTNFACKGPHIDKVVSTLVKAVLLMLDDRMKHIEEGSVLWGKLHKVELDIIDLTGKESVHRYGPSYWNERLYEASRGSSIDDFQKVMIEAVYSLDEAAYSQLKASIDDISWAKKVLAAREGK